MAPVQVDAPSLAARLQAKKRKILTKTQRASISRPESQAFVVRHEENAPQMGAEVAPQVEVNRKEEGGNGTENLGQDETYIADQRNVLPTGDETKEAARAAARVMRKEKKKEKKEKEKEEAETARLAQQEAEVEAAKAKEMGSKKKRATSEVSANEKFDSEEAAKRTTVAPNNAEKVKEVDWRFQFDYDNKEEPFVNNADKCTEQFGLIKGSTSEVPAGEDAVFKDVVSFTFKAVIKRDAAFSVKNSVENRQIEKQRSHRLEVSIKDLTVKVEDIRLENTALINYLQIVNEHHADQKIDSETTRIWVEAEARFSGRIGRLSTYIAKRDAAEMVKLDLVQARGALECLNLLRDEEEMTEEELRADLEQTQ
ncbi:uncharacterized protein LOC112089669 [Eutrema salsugineum]|uniref:uncharacterized protein LOC112089669 n=1 Tax=Eutrema salsugineum TaxID=72664 RepID=UPI000CED70AF|nr:uncharacterized protein LOC112089669 [Eutrema salsugineum]